MDHPKPSSFLLDKLVKGSEINDTEIKELKQIFSQKKYDVNDWLNKNWNEASYSDLDIDFAGLKNKIKENEKTTKFRYLNSLRKINNTYKRFAAILFIPLLLGSISYLIYATLFQTESFYTSEAPLGQKTKVILPDSSTIWLNAGSSITYSNRFNKRFREIKLDGEAFFNVNKNTGKPFIIHTSQMDIEVTGTQFNVNAYPEEPIVNTSLLKGTVKLTLQSINKSYQLKPGTTLSFSKTSKKVFFSELDVEETISWKENRLVFINDDFNKLARKIERWYNIQVIYNPEDFKKNKLTVRLKEGEQLEKLLEIIGTTIDAQCKIEPNKIYITKIKK